MSNRFLPEQGADFKPGVDTPALVQRWLGSPATLLFARVCVTLPFLEAGLIKLVDWQAGEAEMLRSQLHPAWLFNVASLVTELGGSLAVILNRGMWLGAGALGIFTIMATFIAHQFWDLEGPARVAQLNTFLEHATIAAAFILVVVAHIRPRRPVSGPALEIRQHGGQNAS